MAGVRRTGSSPVWSAWGVALLLAGCATWFQQSRDLVDQGVYRLRSDMPENGRCRTEFDVREREGRLVVRGKRNVSGGRCAPTVPPVVEVVEPGGRLVARAETTLSTRPHQRTGHSHALFHVEFDSLPPDGSLIRILYDEATPRESGTGLDGVGVQAIE